MYACNTVNHITYVDCLFLAVSAATTTGLATVDLSLLNPGQQALLFILFVCGSLVSYLDASEDGLTRLVLRVVNHLACQAALFPGSIQRHYQPKATETSTRQEAQSAYHVEDWYLENQPHLTARRESVFCSAAEAAADVP